MPTPYRDVAHLLRRAAFGGLPGEISQLAQLELPQIVDGLLDRTALPVAPRPEVVLDANADWGVKYTQFICAWFERMRTTPVPLAEKMTLFWHGHFTSSLAKTDFQNMWSQIDSFRNLGMGGFRELAQAAAISPAMLEWLDNDSNRRQSPNENFARELMELFTMGPSNYSQDDVRAAARAWTGHGLQNDRHTYAFRSDQHDSTNKTFLGVTKNWDGPDVIDEIVLGSRRNVTARFIARKIWTYFAHSMPSDALVDELAASFAGSNMNISSLLRAVFLHPEFYGDDARHRHVRSPAEFIAAIYRYTGIDTVKFQPQWYLGPMGQYLLQPPHVAGWGVNEYWVSTSATWARSNTARQAMWKAKEAGLLADTNKTSIQTAAQRTLDAFGIDEPSVATRQLLEKYVYDERYARGWGESQNLIQLGMMSPEFQVG